jgi:hypothetical protein
MQMNAQPTCPDCSTAMEVGFTPDYYASIIQSRWHPGMADEKTFAGNLKLDPNALIPVTAFRCPQCGLLKQYATR